MHEAYDRVPVPLTMHHDPICVSFAVVCPPLEAGADGAGAKPVLLADPTAAEEAVADATVVVTASGTTEKSVLFGLHKHGGVPVPAEHIMRCSTAGCLQAAERNAQIREILKRFEARLPPPLHTRLVDTPRPSPRTNRTRRVPHPVLGVPALLSAGGTPLLPGSLRRLRLDGCAALCPRLAEALPPTLTHLHLNGCAGVSDAGLEAPPLPY